MKAPSYFAYNEMRWHSKRAARLLNPDQKRELLEAIQARERLTNKALATRFGLKRQQIADQVRRLRAYLLG